ncbi:hypothetical protein EMIHUDRAFT_250946 [Emiliania huxleyi CCMP1516]|uniref:JmjC domain-containing protein n=2 Tax=Emiliania huxleyi TaxID=2903 RepID=A0A0D3KYY5_EMIH1|nr:hypothetical protein EMIHUDRAFT_250946 [Emiliania huxleyi CCMP1516]EOD40970.1 hypothetical protein EMIHUDRAFT_250946 [Emiliania huxleyi CCMP1516]|eukprot:XP_005793399.1 hypothetical protein EMIHUDRAFT_250946 [Emiliania huxleyi CCMP1516]
MSSPRSQTPREFAAKFRHKRPVLLRGFANDWPAVSAWLDVEHLRGLLPGKSVTVLRAGEFKEANCGVWLGSFLIGVRGTKRVTYFAPGDFRALYPRANQPELSQGGEGAEGTAAGRAERAARASSAEATARSKNAEMQGSRTVWATAWHATLSPGDALYTPPYYWHHVETAADEAALSVLVPFDPSAEEPVHACHFR